MNKILRRILLCSLLFAASVSVESQENKTALVIGNASYRHFPTRNQPYGEAQKMGDALRRLGFDVILVLNATENQMMDALADFEYKLKTRGDWLCSTMGGMVFR